MNISQEYLDLIDKKVNDLLSSDEVNRFEELMQQDEFKSAYEEVLKLKEGIRLNHLKEKKKLFESWEDEVGQVPIAADQRFKEHKIKPNNSSRRTWIMRLAAAATILFAGFLLWQVNQSSKIDRLLEEHFEHYPSNIGVMRSDANSEISQLKLRAYNLYEIYEYKDAAPLLYKVYEEERDTMSLFYAGVAYLGSGDLDRAEECFVEVEFTEIPDSDRLKFVDFIEIIKNMK